MKRILALLAFLISGSIVSATPSTGTWTPIDITGEELSFTVAEATYVVTDGITCIQTTFTVPTTTSNEDVFIGGAPLSAEGSFWPLSIGFGQAGQSFTAVISSSSEYSGIGLYKVNGDALKYFELSGKVIIIGGCYHGVA